MTAGSSRKWAFKTHLYGLQFPVQQAARAPPADSPSTTHSPAMLRAVRHNRDALHGAHNSCRPPAQPAQNPAQTANQPAQPAAAARTLMKGQEAPVCGQGFGRETRVCVLRLTQALPVTQKPLMSRAVAVIWAPPPYCKAQQAVKIFKALSMDAHSMGLICPMEVVE